MMKPARLTLKQQQRIERKKKKIAAFLEVAQLNDQERYEKQVKLAEENQSKEDTDDSANGEVNMSGDGPCRKKLKKEGLEKNELKKSAVNDQVHKLKNQEVESANPNDSSCKLLLDSESYASLKKQLRERKKILTQIPRIFLNEGGEQASLQFERSERIPLFISDIQDLIVHFLHSRVNHFYSKKPRWCNVEKISRISKCVLLVIEGFSIEEYITNESLLPTLKNDFSTKMEVILSNAYGGHLLDELISVPLCSYEQKKLLEQYETVEKAMADNSHLRYKVLRALFPITRNNNDNSELKLPPKDRFPRTDLLLSAWQLIEEGYPVPIKGVVNKKYQNYIPTKDQYCEVTPFSPMFALDCEMCQTTTGQLELTRISVVDEDLNVLYDTLVKPRNPIINYLTQFSGVTKKMLDPVTTRLPEVQQKIRELLPPDAILVGQSLHGDLNAMQMMHPYVIDTSVIFNITGIRSRKTKLMTLSREFLSETIQNKFGHCSAEDSIACMKLVQLKLAKSIEFGDAVLVGIAEAESHMQEIQSENKSQNPNELIKIGAKELTSNLFHQTASVGKKGALIASEKVVFRYSRYIGDNQKVKESTKKIVASTNDEIMSKTHEAILDNDVIITHLQLDPNEKDTKTIKKVNKWTKKMLKYLTGNGLCLVLLGNGANDSNGVFCVHIKQPDLHHVVNASLKNVTV